MVAGCLLFVCSWSAEGPCDMMLGVVPAWTEFVFLWGGGGGEGCFWEGGCDGMSLVGESETFGTSLLEMSCCTCRLLAGCFPWRFLPWMKMSCDCHMCFLVGELCVACSCLAFVVGLRWGLVDA